MSIRIAVTIIVAAALAACTGSFTKPTATEADFGNSVASMIKSQTADPAPPSTEPVTGVDPDYANKVIDALREGVSKPEQVREPITIRVGWQSQGGN
jgi:hypothetical protein